MPSDRLRYQNSNSTNRCLEPRIHGNSRHHSWTVAGSRRQERSKSKQFSSAQQVNCVDEARYRRKSHILDVVQMADDTLPSTMAVLLVASIAGGRRRAIRSGKAVAQDLIYRL